MTQKTSKLLALMLALTLAIGLLPLSAFALDDSLANVTTLFEQAAEPTESPPMEAAEPAEPEQTEETAEPDQSEEPSGSSDPTEEPPEEPSESATPADEPSEESSELAGPTEPTELVDPTQEPVDADAEATNSSDDALEPEEPIEPKPAAEVNGAYHVGGSVTVYQWYDPRIDLKEKSSEGFPYLTDYGSDYDYNYGTYPSSSAYGTLFYCLEYDVHGATNQGTTTNGTDLLKTPAWYMLPEKAKWGITWALLYGVPNCSSYYDNIYGYAATQLIIWEYQLGYRTTASQTVTFFSATLNQSATLREAYNSILSSIRSHEKAPSFAGQELVLYGYGVENGVTLTDSNGLFGKDTWKVSETTGFASTQSGNSLTIYAPEGSSAPIGEATTIRLTRNIKTTTGAALCAKTGAQTCITGSPPDPLNVSLRVRLDAAGTATMKKTSSSANVEGFCMKLYRHGSKDTWYGKSDADGSIYVTDSTYTAAGEKVYTFDGLTDGEYTVLEVLSQSAQPDVKTTSFTLTVYDEDGNQTSSKTYAEGEFTFDPNGDARLAQVAITGINGGGRLEISVNNELATGTATIKKTSSSGTVGGFCFELLNHGNGKSWYAKTDSSGNAYETDASCNQSGTKVYTLDGLTDGTYDISEILSKSDQQNFKVTSITLTVRDKDGNQTSKQTFGEADITVDANGDACLRNVALTGINGGGRLEIAVNNELDTGTAVMKKTSSTGNVEGFCFELLNHGNGKSWYAKTDSFGNAYATDVNYAQSGTKVYTFDGLTDGSYDICEVLSKSDQQNFKVTSITLTVRDKDGNQTSKQEFSEADITVDANGDACLQNVALTGINGGGKLEIVINNELNTGMATIKKTSSSGTVEGFCFELYNSDDGKSWHGRSDADGNVYATNNRFVATSPKVYTFEGLTDGTYDLREALSQSYYLGYKPTSITLTVRDKDGNVTNSQTFDESDIFMGADGDAYLEQVYLTGITGGGCLEISVNNEPILGAITINKADAAGRPLKGATFRLEYAVGSKWIPVRPSQNIGVGLCSSLGLSSSGELTTGEDGTVTFEGLTLYDGDEAILYRVVETKAPVNFLLHADPVFCGEIHAGNNDTYHAYVDVCDTPLLALPPAGEGGFALLPLAVLGMAACAAAIWFIISRKKSTIN